MRRAWLTVALACGCSLHVDYTGTSYRCDEGQACPAGYDCVNGVCVRPGGDPDGGPPPDAPPGADAPRADAEVLPLDPPWWDDAWLHRRRITVTNVSDDEVAPEDLTVALRWDLESLVGAAPYESVRLMHWNAGTGVWLQMTRVIDDSDQSNDELVWFALWEPLAPGGGAVDHYWLYYGNDNPANDVQDAPSYLFDAWHSFSALDPALEIEGAATVAGGELRLDFAEDLGTIMTWGPGYAVDFRLHAPTWGPRIWGGWQAANTFADDEPWALWITRSQNDGQIGPEFLAYATGVTATWEGALAPLAAAGYVNFTVERYDQLVVYRQEWDVKDTHVPAQPHTALMRARLTNESPNAVYWDFLRVRRSMYPAPTVTLGPEETRP